MKFEFGQTIPGLKIRGKEANYPVMDERSVRAGAGIMLMLAVFAFSHAFLTKNFAYLNIFVLLFFTEFLIRVAINPDYAPIYILGRYLVRKQEPEWVGAIQKRFAWTLGLIMAGSMIIIVPILQIRGALPLSICSICIFLLWAESTLGICVGCKIYTALIKHKIINPKVRAACPGGACELKFDK